jgi:hypothetical protein
MKTERTAEDWGRVAVSLPGWRWMPGMLAAGPTGPRGGRPRVIITGTMSRDDAPRAVDFKGRRCPAWYALNCDETEVSIDPDDPATAGCMLALLGEQWGAYHYRPHPHPSYTPYEVVLDGVEDWVTDAFTLGRSCIAAAEALGRWPGGAS